MKLNKLSVILILIFSIYTLLLVGIHIDTPYTDIFYRLASSYGLIALYGGVVGIKASLKWGGLKSLLGKSIFFLSLGLLAQEFGQLAYLYYIEIAHVDIPYPSLGDLGFFGSIPLYAFGIWSLAHVIGVKSGIKEFKNKMLAVVVPVILLGLSYFMFLPVYQFDWTAPLAVFLDFGYPLGQAIYISMAIVVVIVSNKYLGGALRNSIMIILIALCIQYFADFTFLYQVSRETWEPAGINDFTYILAYFLMSVGLIEIGSDFSEMSIKNKK